MSLCRNLVAVSLVGLVEWLVCTTVCVQYRELCITYLLYMLNIC